MQAVLSVIAAANADVLVLQSIDWDHELRALTALNAALGPGAQPYPHLFALQPNTGVPTGLDMDGNGRFGRAGDAQGFGDFLGQGGMAVLSRLPIDRARAVALTEILWHDVPHAVLPQHPNGDPFPSAEALGAQRLSQTAHWDVPLVLPGGERLHLLTHHASPPVLSLIHI